MRKFKANRGIKIHMLFKRKKCTSLRVNNAHPAHAMRIVSMSVLTVVNRSFLIYCFMKKSDRVTIRITPSGGIVDISCCSVVTDQGNISFAERIIMVKNIVII